MARNVAVVITDDLDGSPDAETVRFGVDGTAYEVDLGASNRIKFEEAIAPYIEHGRRITRGRARPAAARSATRRSDLAAVRAWAKEQGLHVSERGRVSAEVLNQYEASH